MQAELRSVEYRLQELKIRLDAALRLHEQQVWRKQAAEQARRSETARSKADAERLQQAAASQVCPQPLKPRHCAEPHLLVVCIPISSLRAAVMQCTMWRELSLQAGSGEGAYMFSI